jgi:hypothetical protein
MCASMEAISGKPEFGGPHDTLGVSGAPRRERARHSAGFSVDGGETAPLQGAPMETRRAE